MVVRNGNGVKMQLDNDYLRNRASNLSDDELFKIAFDDSHEYQPDAVQVAREELIKRGHVLGQDGNEIVVTRPEPAEPQYKGVGGWLLLLCLGLTVFTPLLTIGSLATAYRMSLEYFDQFPGLLVITVIDTILSLGLIAFGFYAGIGLWSIRPGAVKMAKRFLLCTLGYQAIAAILQFMAGLPSTATATILSQVAICVLRSVIYFAVWYSYLDKSKRVAATYHC
jgi:uncharacterized protein DUF2569